MVAPVRTHLTPVETRYTRTLDKRVLKNIRAHDIIRPNERLIVAVSGGPDSTAMLLALARIAPTLNLTLTVAHYDHMLRDTADHAADRDFVEALATTLGLDFTSARGDVPARVRKHKESTEDAARKMRYDFLGAESTRSSATAVAVGHTADDRAETVLLHLIRGAGLDGLAAMPARSPWPFGAGPDIARPLLGLTRAETERYCRESTIDPRIDHTNALPAATRNRVRHQLLPLMRDFNPRIERALIRLAETAARDTGYLDLAADAEYRRLARHDADTVTFDRAELVALHPAIAARLLRRAAVQLGGSPESDRIDELLSVLPQGRTVIDLPGSVTATIAHNKVTLIRTNLR